MENTFEFLTARRPDSKEPDLQYEDDDDEGFGNSGDAMCGVSSSLFIHHCTSVPKCTGFDSPMSGNATGRLDGPFRRHFPFLVFFLVF
jgi:hypothetical protein